MTPRSRNRTRVAPSEAGRAVLAEARAILARHDQALRRMAEFTTEGRGAFWLGVPMELPPDLLHTALTKFIANCPDTRVMPRHLSTAAQVSSASVSTPADLNCEAPASLSMADGIDRGELHTP
jgi:DNA-binding transcriptional LysR family regulator